MFKLKDLVSDAKTGRLRETALWSNVGKASMTAAFWWLTYKNLLTEWYVLAYGGIVILHEMGSKLLNQRQQKVDKEEPPPPSVPS